MTNERTIRTYSKLITLDTFEDRYEYLKLNGKVGEDTFGFERYMNQSFYKSNEWRDIRDYVIVRDNGSDLAMDGYEIYGNILIHHMNPITKEDIVNRTPYLIDPEYLICTTKNTHNAIHYGDKNLLISSPIIRRKNDTCPWRHN